MGTFICLNQLTSIDMHIAGYAGLSHEDGKILVSNGILGEVLAGEVQHHGRCVIEIGRAHV